MEAARQHGPSQEAIASASQYNPSFTYGYQPGGPWPKSEGFEVILVVVDRLTKYAHFFPLKHPYTAHSVATVFVDNIVKLHGVPASIVSDRDRVFTSHFWRRLFKEIGTKLCYSTAYHPQTDSQSERVNQCLE